MSEFKSARDMNFFQRVFGGRRYTAQEVDAIQGQEASEYSATFGTMQGDYATALQDETPPEEWLASGKTQDQWGKFRNQEKDKSLTGFTASKYITIYGKDKFLQNLPADTAKETLSTFQDKETGQFKFFDPFNSPTYKNEAGEEVTDVNVRTATMGEDGTAKMRTNNLTADGSNQRDSEDPGIALDNSQLDAFFELARLEKAKKSGGRITESLKRLDQELLNEQNLDIDEAILSGDRSVTLNAAEKIANYFKEKGISVKDTTTGERFSADDSVTAAADQASADAMPNLEGTLSGSTVNPANPAVVKANEIVTSYKRGDNINAEDLAGGLSKGFQKTFTRDFNSSQTRVDAARTRIAALEQKREKDGELSKGDQQRLAGAEKQLERSLDSQERLVERVKNNIESDAKTYRERVAGDQSKLTEDLDRVNFNLTVESVSPAGKEKLLTEQGNTLKKFLTGKHLDTPGSEKTVVNQVLASKGNDLKAIQGNGPLMEDLKNLSGAELNQKYMNQDGSLNTEAIYGKEYEPEVESILKKTVSNKQIADFVSAVKSGDQEKIDAVVDSINISEEDERQLTSVITQSASGANYAKGAQGPGGRGKARAFAIIAMSTMDKSSPEYKRLTSAPYLSMIETGRFTGDQLNYQSKIYNNARLDRAMRDVSSPVKVEIDQVREMIVDFGTDEDSPLYENAQALFKNVSPRITAAKQQATNAADQRAVLTYTMEMMKKFQQTLEPSTFQKIFSLGFARGGKLNMFGENIDIKPIIKGNELIGFRSGSAEIKLNDAAQDYDPRFINALKEIAIRN
jgi:hypothetical protein